MVDVKYGPNCAVTNLSAPKRDNNYNFTSTWKYPSKFWNDNNDARAEAVWVFFDIFYKEKDKSTGKVTEDKITVYQRKTSSTQTSATFNLAGFTDKDGHSHNRKSFYPYTEKRITSITCTVQARNGSNDSRGGNPVSATRKIAAPPAPKVANPSIDTSTGEVSARFTPADKKGYRERVQTECVVQTSTDASGASIKSFTKDAGKITGSDSAFTKSVDLTDWQVSGRHRAVRFRARSHGLGGVSKWTGWKVLVTGAPKKPVIKSAKVTGRASSESGTAVIQVSSTTFRPVDYVKLQVLKNVTASTKSEALSNDYANSWNDLSSDDGQCKALAFSVADTKPDPGKHSWLRVKAWNDLETICTYSDPFEIKELYKKTAGTGSVTIGTVASGADGTSLTIPLTWTAPSTLSADEGVIVAWSKNPDAWDSNDQPATQQVPDMGMSGNHRGSLTFNITGLDSGEEYCVWAMRYQESENGTAYGEMAGPTYAIPAIQPDGVTLSAPPSIPSGSDLELSWTFGGGGEQVQYQIVAENNPDRVVQFLVTPVQSARLPWSFIDRYSSQGAITLRVDVSTDGKTYERSGSVTVYVDTPPELSVSASTLTAQPLSLALSCDRYGCSVAVVVTSQGCSGVPDLNIPDQLEGDTVWTDVITPEWSYSDSAWRATIEPYVSDAEAESGEETFNPTPAFLDLRDGCTYGVAVMATDPDTGLSSEIATAEFVVGWTTQATIPETPTITASGKSASIALPAGSGTRDIYRLNGDRAALIYQGALPGQTILDPYAPFGDRTAYRIAMRTADGDVEYADFAYTLKANVLRFDWGEDFVELPWNLELSDSWKKHFEGTSMLDGSTVGDWSGVERTGSYRTAMIRVSEEEDIAKVRELGRYGGPVLVRTLLGTCLCANVDVDSMDMSALGGRGLSVSFGIREIDLTDEYMGRLS